ncbi:hypothetical protein AAMO2058_001208700 [Amorphochlora amoebiformis]
MEALPRPLYQAVTQCLKNKRTVFRVRHSVKLLKPLRNLASEGYIRSYVKQDKHILVTLRKGRDGQAIQSVARKPEVRRGVPVSVRSRANQETPEWRYQPMF